MSRYVKGMYFGIRDDNRDIIGIVKRSGRVRILGHFGFVEISVNGHKAWAGGAEDRIFPFHSVDLKEIGGKTPKDMIPALGWCDDGNTYAFEHKGEPVFVARGVALVGVPPGVKVKPKESVWKCDLCGNIIRCSKCERAGECMFRNRLMEEHDGEPCERCTEGTYRKE